VDEFRNELRATRGFRVAHRLIPVEHRRTVWVRIEVVVAMRPVTLPYDEVRYSVAVHVAIGRAMWFGEGDASGILRREIIHDHVLHE